MGVVSPRKEDKAVGVSKRKGSPELQKAAWRRLGSLRPGPRRVPLVLPEASAPAALSTR